MKKIKNYIVSLAGLAILGAGLFLIKAVSEPEGILKTLPFLCIGIGCGIFGYGVSNVFTQLAVRNRPDMAEQMEINAQDERNVAIGSRAKAKGFDMMTYVFGALMLAFALMNASVGILIPMVIAYLLVEGCALYYRFKFEKEM